MHLNISIERMTQMHERRIKEMDILNKKILDLQDEIKSNSDSYARLSQKYFTQLQESLLPGKVVVPSVRVEVTEAARERLKASSKIVSRTDDDYLVQYSIRMNTLDSPGKELSRLMDDKKRCHVELKEIKELVDQKIEEKKGNKGPNILSSMADLKDLFLSKFKRSPTPSSSDDNLSDSGLSDRMKKR